MPRFRFPDSLVLIFGLIVAAQAATYVLPAGTFKREGRKVVPGTYREVAAEPLPAATFLTAIPKGMEKAADIIFFVFLIGGVIGIVRATGAIDALIGAAIRHLGKSPVLLVAGTMTLFSLGSSTIGMAEEYMPFVPILVTMCIALGMDAIVAMGIIYIGAGVGYGCAALNPFTVMIAQRIAGLPPASGQGPRWVLLAICIAAGVAWVMRYARRLRADPARSLVADVDYSRGFSMPEDVRFTPQRKAIIAAFVLTIAVFVAGVWRAEWYLTELSALFLALGLISALLSWMHPNDAARHFCAGAADLTTAALLIGFARTIQVVLDAGKVTDTIIQRIAGALRGLPPAVAAVGMLAVQAVINFFIPSGSGQAYVTMPIMAPLADVVDVTRQTAVLAYQFGDGFSNMVIPTNALLMGMLGLARIPYQRWLRFALPPLMLFYAISAAALVAAVLLGYR